MAILAVPMVLAGFAAGDVRGRLVQPMVLLVQKTESATLCRCKLHPFPDPVSYARLVDLLLYYYIYQDRITCLPTTDIAAQTR
jgi:hypothetical protein